MATESKHLIVLALIAKGCIAVTKFVAAGISGSAAVLSAVERFEGRVGEACPDATQVFVEPVRV